MRISDWSSDVCSSDLSDEVAGARAGAVDGKMRKELRRVPIHMREVAFCYQDRSDAAPPHLGRLEMDLEPNVEGPLPLVPKIVGGSGLRLGIMAVGQQRLDRDNPRRSEEHKSEVQSLMRISYAACCLK